VVIRTVLAACAAGLIAFAVWYAVAVALPRREEEKLARRNDEAALTMLAYRVTVIERALHLH